jgi:hypothetical protein
MMCHTRFAGFPYDVNTALIYFGSQRMPFMPGEIITQAAAGRMGRTWRLRSAAKALK